MKKKILVIAKEKKINNNLKSALKANGYKSEFCSDMLKALNRLKAGQTDIIIAQTNNNIKENINFINKVRKINPKAILFIISDNCSNNHKEERLLRLGVFECLPISFTREAINRGLKRAVFQLNLEQQCALLERKIALLNTKNGLLIKKLSETEDNIKRLSNDLQDAYMQTIKTLAQAIDARDHYTHSHSENVTRYAVGIANLMQIKPEIVEKIREACELHDLGKIAVCDYILSKSEPLNEEEWRQIKTHSSKAVEILKPLHYLGEVIEIIYQHHEHFDGKGYPEEKKGEAIVLGARIIAVADAYDAMTSARSYRKTPLTKEQAIEELRRNRGVQFDPQVVDAFLKIVDKL